jgi:glycosyltransferase involved in cell wall biosynthesis
LLYVGSAYPHKNLERLVKAFEIINKKNKYQLVIGGKFDYFMNRLKSWVNKNFTQENNIIFTGFLNDRELNSLLQKALIFTFPSLSEGFGLPALEAQINNLAIASSDQTCLKEILGKGALYFNPFDLEDMSSKIKMLLDSKSFRIKLIKLGQENVKKYSWIKMAEDTLSIYNDFDLPR